MSDNVIEGGFRKQSGKKLLEDLLEGKGDDIRNVMVIFTDENHEAGIAMNSLDVNFLGFCNIATTDLALAAFNGGLKPGGSLK